MFSKSKTPKAQKTRAKPAQSAVPQTPSLISQGLSISGDLKSQGEIQVDGTVQGDIDCSRLVIGEKASVRGEVIAEQIIIRGEIQGRVLGGQVSLAKTARVLGDIYHRSLSMEAGAHLEGQVKKTDDPRANRPTTEVPHLLQTARSAPRLDPTRLNAGPREVETDLAAG